MRGDLRGIQPDRHQGRGGKKHTRGREPAFYTPDFVRTGGRPESPQKAGWIGKETQANTAV